MFSPKKYNYSDKHYGGCSGISIVIASEKVKRSEKIKNKLILQSLKTRQK